MILYPAIDLKDGQCVRLVRGEMEAATVFNDDPAAQARAFADAGCEWLHLVDLNGAFEGRPVNGAAVEAILAAVAIPAQLGGGIRDMATIEAWLARGLRRVILGTVAVRDPALVKAAAKAFPGRVAVGIDARKGMVAVEGWAETTDLTALDLARQVRGRRRRRDHLHRHRPRRGDAGTERGSDRRIGACRGDSGDRLGRGLVDGGPPRAQGLRRAARRCDFRPGAL